MRKGKIILHQGEKPRRFGLVIKGLVHVMQIDDQGNHTIVAPAGEGEMFGETFACAGVKALPVSAVAAEDCEILMMEHERVIMGCRNGCLSHSRLVTNLMRSKGVRGRIGLRFPLTVRRWRIIWLWSAAPCARS